MLRALVVGHGHMGRFHARALRDLGYEVTTVDPHAPADHRTMPPLYRYQIAAVATPPHQLPNYGLACAKAGLKTLIEKPFAPTFEQAQTLAEQVDGLDVCVGFIERFNPTVRRLKEQLEDIGQPVLATFTRWNTRPAPDPLTALRIHDVDLNHYLGLSCQTIYNTRSDAPVKRRTITIVGTSGQITADLMDHDTSPLHALWHAFLTGRPVPGPQDAINAHKALNSTVEALAA